MTVLYIRTFDSGGRRHDGFFCYETQMRVLIPRIWLCKIKKETIKKPTGKYGGTIPLPTLKKGAKSASVGNLQKFLNWYHPKWKLAVDCVFGAETEAALKGFQKTEGLATDGMYGKQCYAKAKAYEYVPPKKKEPKKAEKKTPVKKKVETKKPVEIPKEKKTVKISLKSYRIEIDLTNQIATVYGI